MGLYKFSIAAAASPSDIEAKITSVRGQGANIYLHSIVDIGNLNLSINNKNVTINYDLVGTKQNSLFNWYICDTVGYETIIILYNSGTESDSTFGLANYNRIYFNVKNQLVSNPKISVTLAAQFNVLRGRFDSYESDGSDDDVIMLTKCVYNDGSNIETGEAIVTDNLYVSTNLRSTSFKTIVKDENNKQFINVGGVFYLPYSEKITYPSFSEKQWILPLGSVNHEWHPATIVANHKWYDTDNNKNFSFQNCSYETNINNFYKSVIRIGSSIIPGGATYLENIDFFNSSSNSLIFYGIIASREKCDEYEPYLQLCHYNNKEYGIYFYGDSTIQIKVNTITSESKEYFATGEDSLKYNVYAVKISEFGDRISTDRYTANFSVYINGKFIRLFNNVICSNWLRLGISNFKYVGIVEHDQTSDEIIKNSQLLMKKFGIY